MIYDRAALFEFRLSSARFECREYWADGGKVRSLDANGAAEEPQAERILLKFTKKSRAPIHSVHVNQSHLDRGQQPTTYQENFEDAELTRPPTEASSVAQFPFLACCLCCGNASDKSSSQHLQRRMIVSALSPCRAPAKAPSRPLNCGMPALS